MNSYLLVCSLRGTSQALHGHAGYIMRTKEDSFLIRFSLLLPPARTLFFMVEVSHPIRISFYLIIS